MTKRGHESRRLCFPEEEISDWDESSPPPKAPRRDAGQAGVDVGVPSTSAQVVEDLMPSILLTPMLPGPSQSLLQSPVVDVPNALQSAPRGVDSGAIGMESLEGRFDLFSRELNSIKLLLSQSQLGLSAPALGNYPTQRGSQANTDALSDLMPPAPPVAPELEVLETTLADSLKKADDARIEAVIKLQHFNDPEWANIRYTETQKKYLATPAFTFLDLNEELTPFESKPYFLRSLDQSFAVLTNMLLAQREAVQTAIKNILALKDAPASLHSTLAEAFASGSLYSEVSKDLLQVVCGRRASILEQRRDAVLSGVRDKYNKVSLKRVPPSHDCLFDKAAFSEALTKIGGGSKVFRRPNLPAEGRQASPNRAQLPMATNFRASGSAAFNRTRAPVPAAKSKPAPATRRSDGQRNRQYQRRHDDGRSRRRQ